MTQDNHIDQPLENRPVSANQEEMEDEINLIDLVYPIYKRRKFLIRFCLVIAAAAGIWSFLMPKTYEATAVILPISEDNNSSSLSGLASSLLGQSALGGLVNLGGASSTSSDTFEAILNSNELAADVLKRYDYFSMMGISIKAENAAIKSLAGSLTVTSSKKDPTISISIQSKDPILASELANSYVKGLDNYNLNNTFTSAGRLRQYIEKRMDEASRELDQAQAELQGFQEKNKTVSVSQQAEATLKVLGEMEAQRLALEVEKQSKEKFFKGSHYEIGQLDAQIDALKKNIDNLTYSNQGSVPIETEKGKVEFYIPLTSMTGLSFDESKLLLKVKAKTGVITLLTTQLEQAKLDEAKDIPTINILEWASPPERPVKPKIFLNVILSVVVSFFLGVFIVFFMEFIKRMDQDPETAPKWQEMKNALTGFFKFKRRYGR
jgi:tyrosine-protein kinase Etk/Wzc